MNYPGSLAGGIFALAVLAWAAPTAAQHEGHEKMMSAPKKQASSPVRNKTAAMSRKTPIRKKTTAVSRKTHVRKKTAAPARKVSARQTVPVRRKRSATSTSSVRARGPVTRRPSVRRPAPAHMGHAASAPSAGRAKPQQPTPRAAAAPAHARHAVPPPVGTQPPAKSAANQAPATRAAGASAPATPEHAGHAMPQPVRNQQSVSPQVAAPGHAGHTMPKARGAGGGMQLGGAHAGGMSIDSMMAIQGMLTESRKHSQAALQSLEELASAIQEARQAGDRIQSTRALERAQKSLEKAREHLGRSQYSLDMSGDVQRLEMNPAAAAPHLGGRHETLPDAGPGEGPSRVRPGMAPTGGPQGHGGHGPGTGTPNGGVREQERAGEVPSGRGGVEGGRSPAPLGQRDSSLVPDRSIELPSLVRGTPGMPGAPGLSGSSASGPRGPLDNGRRDVGDRISGRPSGGPAGSGAGGAGRGAAGGTAGAGGR